MELRTIALATTALVAIASMAAPAQAGQYMGKLNLGLGYAWEDWDGADSNYSVLHGGASVNVPYSENVNLQFDIFGDASMDKAFLPGRDGSFYGGFGAGLHLNHKDSDGALGAFIAVGRAAVGSTSSSDGVVFAAGLEGEYYCNAWTLSAQIGYLDSDESVFGLMKNAGFVKLGTAYYASKQLKLSGNVGYINGDTTATGGASDVDEWNWGLGAEYLFGKSIPVSAYLEYKGQHSEAFSPNSFDVDRSEVRAGVRFYFGGGDDLQKADREGPSFESPDLITWPRFAGD